MIPFIPLALALAAMQAPQQPRVTLPGGTSYSDTVVGTGAAAENGRGVAVHYTGWLYLDGAKGTRFDSSLDRGEPFVFRLGYGSVILGWDEGIVGMRQGGKRVLIVPPAAGYGDRGAGPDIPPGSTLIFEVELLATESPPPAP